MISYKIITKELYDNLAKNSADIPSQKTVLLHSNDQLILKVNQFRERIDTLEVQLNQQKLKGYELSYQLNNLRSKFDEVSSKLVLETEKIQILQKKKNETAVLLENALKQKKQILAQNSNLVSRISVLESGIIALNQKNEILVQKQKLFQSKIIVMNQNINTENAQKVNLMSKLNQKQQAVKNLNLKLNQNTQLLQKIISQYQQCKEKKVVLEAELQKFKDSPLPKLLQKITANQTWITQLTKTINELKQRCVELQMERPISHLKTAPSFNYYPKRPFQVRPKTSYPPQVPTYVAKLSNVNQKIPAVANQNKKQPYFFTAESRSDETQRQKYIVICKQLFQQFNSKLSKIQQEKKSMEEKFQTLKLRLNGYQYNEFKYKDKIALYLNKIERYQKLTEKQHSEMENLILEFDQELQNIVKIKEEEVKSKLEQEISKYQSELQRLKQEEELTKKLEEKAYQELMKHEVINDDFEYEMLKQLLDQTQQQLAQKQSESSVLRHDLQKRTKQLQKYKLSKQSYKQKALTLQEQCYDNSIEIRRLKGIIQQLCQQLQTKSNENLMLKSTLQKDHNLTNRSDQNSRLNYPNQFNQNLSAKLSLGKNLSGGKRSVSELFEYQFSQIDIEIQRRNEYFLNQILMKRSEEFQKFVSNTPVEPQRVSQHSDQAHSSHPFWTKPLKHSFKDSLDSINKSQVSSQSQNEQNKEKQKNSASNYPNQSASVKNSYQIYGIRNLYKEKISVMQSWGQRYLQHKTSLQ